MVKEHSHFQKEQDMATINITSKKTKTINIENDDDTSNDDEIPEELEQDESCPVILLIKEEKKRMRQPWNSSSIIRMFSVSVGYMGLMRKLKKKWSLKGDLSLTNIGHKYFSVRFNNLGDYNYVLTQGP